MNLSLKCLGTVVSSLSLFTVSLSFSLPAQASLPCQRGTVELYQNGSVAGCIIDNNIHISMGSLAFPCKQGYSVSFDEKGKLQSCVLSRQVTVRTGNTIDTCLADYRVYVSFSKDGDHSVSCQ